MTRRTQRAEARARFHQEDAPALARAAAGAAGPLVPLEVPEGWRASKAMTLLRDPDDSVLVVVVSPDEQRATLDLALAHGLSFQGDRDLRLVLPDEGAERWRPTLWRMAWLRPSVRLLLYTPGEADLAEQIVPPRWQVLAAMRTDDRLRIDDHDLGAGRVFVDGLVARLDADPRLQAAHRESYRAWHVLGRQVLRLQRGPRGLVRMTAGVPFKERPDWAPPAVDRELTEALTASEIAALMELVGTFADARIDGRDSGSAEHELQARLATPEGLAAMRLEGTLLRELPASRPGQRRAYIDLVGVDPWGRIHLVETKVGRDLGVVFQALDYRIWAEAWQGELRQALVDRGHVYLSRRPRITVDVLVATDRGEAMLANLAPQLEAIDGSVKLRVGIASSWRADEPLKIRWYSGRSVVNAGPHPRFAARMEVARGALARARGLLTRTPFLKGPEVALPDAALPELQRLCAAGLDHPQLAHLRSSQGFALALFGGLTRVETLELGRLLLPGLVEVEEPVLELFDADDGLQERTARSPHQTQVDVGIRGTLDDGRRAMLFIEVKLSEDDFNGCSAWQASRNDSTACCEAEGPFGGSRESCFQLRNHDYTAAGGGRRRRRYDAFVPDRALPDAAGTQGVGPGCPFRHSGNQPMRLVAMAGQAVSEGAVDVAVVALSAPGGHGAIWRRWAEVQRSVPLPDGVSWGSLPAESLEGVGRWPVPLWPAEGP